MVGLEDCKVTPEGPAVVAFISGCDGLDDGGLLFCCDHLGHLDVEESGLVGEA